MKKTIEERKEYAKIIAKAWVDEEFKKRLLADPATVLKENGIEIPEGMTVKVGGGVRLDIYGFEGVNCQEWHGEHAFTIRDMSIM